MQLRVARLCLDCEEVHQELHCPICTSDGFAYLSRWVPVEERRTIRRAPAPVAPPPARRARWIAGGAVGLAALATAQLLFGGRKSNGARASKDAAAGGSADEIQN